MMRYQAILYLLMFAVDSKILLIFAEEFKNWNYTISSFSTFNSGPEKLINTDKVKLTRISRGQYAFNGTFSIDTPLDNTVSIEFKFYHSRNGIDAYKLTPFKVPKIPFVDFVNTAYKRYGMEECSKCTDFLVFEGFWTQPVPVGNYSMNMCQFTTRNLPSHLKEGYYKIVEEVTRGGSKHVDEAIVIITNKFSSLF